MVGPEGFLAAFAVEGSVFQGAHGEPGLGLQEDTVEAIVAEAVARDDAEVEAVARRPQFVVDLWSMRAFGATSNDARFAISMASP